MRFPRIVLAAVLGTSLSVPAQAQGTSLLLNSFLAPQHPVTRIVIKPWAEKVTAATEGRVKVEVAPASLAAPAPAAGRR